MLSLFPAIPQTLTNTNTPCTIAPTPCPQGSSGITSLNRIGQTTFILHHLLPRAIFIIIDNAIFPSTCTGAQHQGALRQSARPTSGGAAFGDGCDSCRETGRCVDGDIDQRVGRMLLRVVPLAEDSVRLPLSEVGPLRNGGAAVSRGAEGQQRKASQGTQGNETGAHNGAILEPMPNASVTSVDRPWGFCGAGSPPSRRIIPRRSLPVLSPG